MADNFQCEPGITLEPLNLMFVDYNDRGGKLNVQYTSFIAKHSIISFLFDNFI